MATRKMLRMLKRRTSLESACDASELVTMEFLQRGAPDLKPSVYELNTDEDVVFQENIIRVHAEYSFVKGRLPSATQGNAHIDVAALENNRFVRTPGRTPFAFTKSIHGELVLHDEHELLAFAQELLDTLREQAVDLAREQILAYIDEREKGGDREWLAGLANGKSEAEDWAKELKNYRARVEKARVQKEAEAELACARAKKHAEKVERRVASRMTVDPASATAGGEAVPPIGRGAPGTAPVEQDVVIPKSDEPSQ